MFSALCISNLNITYNKVPILEDINLEVSMGEMMALVGASSAGKTTLLRHVSSAAKTS
ncbi:MAG: hypothetical protein DHS20C01_27900 [marine bacterium B5-7]|nr:MAG: hypothetical protein DHS20C01_27900 [marine bacterium B5-7]